MRGALESLIVTGHWDESAVFGLRAEVTVKQRYVVSYPALINPCRAISPNRLVQFIGISKGWSLPASPGRTVY